MHHKANWTQPGLLPEITGVMKVRCVYPDSVLNKKGADHTEQRRLYDNYYSQTSGQKESFLQRWDSIQKLWISAHKKMKPFPSTLPPHARWFFDRSMEVLTPHTVSVSCPESLPVRLNHSFFTFISICVCASMCCCHLSFTTPGTTRMGWIWPTPVALACHSHNYSLWPWWGA